MVTLRKTVTVSASAFASAALGVFGASAVAGTNGSDSAMTIGTSGANERMRTSWWGRVRFTNATLLQSLLPGLSSQLDSRPRAANVKDECRRTSHFGSKRHSRQPIKQ